MFTLAAVSGLSALMVVSDLPVRGFVDYWPTSDDARNGAVFALVGCYPMIPPGHVERPASVRKLLEADSHYDRLITNLSAVSVIVK
jgi:hypothetical protein